MTDKTDLIREIHEYVTTHGGEDTATHLLVQAASAIQTQAAELEAVGAGGVQPLRSVQEGCKLVPLEPTPEMLAALMSPGEAEVLASSPSETFALMLMDRSGIRERYSAMLAASPTPPAEQQATRCSYCDGTGDVHGIDGEWRGFCTECEAGTALRQQAAPKAAPAGWKLVPLEPTQGMLRAATEHSANCGGMASARSYYTAMLAASPTTTACAGSGKGV